MTPKFRIYDKEEEKYINSPRFLLSEDGRLFETFDAFWHDVGERYVVEMSNLVINRNKAEFYVGDVVTCNDVDFYPIVFIDGIILIDGYNNGDYYSGYDPTQTNWDLFKIIGTIHDEKYNKL